jgi:hypothetical protein
MRSVANLVLVVGLLGSGAAAAQPRPGAGNAGERRPGARAAPERREQIKKKIRALRAYTLTEELALDEATATRLFPALARYDDETDRLLQNRVDVQRRLRHADAIRDPRAIERLIDEALANQRAFWGVEERRIAELRKILTPAQTAKVLVVLPALERKIQNQLRRAIVKQEGGRPGAGPGPGPADDPDDDTQPDELDAPAPRPRREAPLPPGSLKPPRSNAPGNTSPCTPGTEPCR